MVSAVDKIGEVGYFFGKISVAVINLGKNLNIGDQLHFRGNTTGLVQSVKSMQIDHEPVEKASSGSEVAIKKVEKRVRQGDRAYLMPDDG